MLHKEDSVHRPARVTRQRTEIYAGNRPTVSGTWGIIACPVDWETAGQDVRETRQEFSGGLAVKSRILGSILMGCTVAGMVALGPLALILADFRKMGQS
jgi:hypothetical protein